MIGDLVLSFVLVFLTEIGDKTMISVLCIAAQRGRPLVILGATTLALLITSVVGIAAGQVLSSVLSRQLLVVASGVLFIVIGFWILTSRSQGNEMCDHSTTFARSFTVVVASEMGDKSQLAILAMATQFPSPVLILCGAMLAFLVVNTIGIAIGHKSSNHIPVRYARLVAAVIFVGFGALTLLAPSVYG